jgi:hypothetical protein
MAIFPYAAPKTTPKQEPRATPIPEFLFLFFSLENFEFNRCTNLLNVAIESNSFFILLKLVRYFYYN